MLANTNNKYESVTELKQFSVANTVEIAGMRSSNNKQLIIGVYRPPQGSIEVFLEQMRCCLHSVFEMDLDFTSIFVGGDFNIDLSRDRRDTSQLQEVFMDFGLGAKFMEPSRITSSSRTLIDNIFSNVNDFKSFTFQPHLSDHMGQIISYNVNTVQEKIEKITRRTTKRSNINQLKSVLQEEIWEISKHTSAKTAFDEFWDKLMHHYDQNCPEKIILRSEGNKKRKNRRNKAVVEMRRQLEALETIMKVRRDEMSTRAYHIHKKSTPRN